MQLRSSTERLRVWWASPSVAMHYRVQAKWSGAPRDGPNEARAQDRLPIGVKKEERVWSVLKIQIRTILYLRVSNPRTIAYFHLKMHSKVRISQGAGLSFLAWTLEEWP